MLLKNENQIIRVLQTHGNKSLVIDCIKRTMPKWIDAAALSAFTECGETALHELTQYPGSRELTQNEQRIAQEHFTMIAGVLPFIGNEQKRNQMMDMLSEHCSKQTLRKYLCLYLVYQDIDALAPPPKAEKELTQDEKNMRWALNKFFYTKHKNSLNTAYTLMLKEKYCDQQGQLVVAYPTFDQFRYFYRKTKKMQQYYISRDGIKDYQRNNRPLLGDGIAEKIIDLYRNEVDIVQIARQTKSTVDDVRHILGLGGMTDFIIQESKSTNRELQGFKSTDCLELFSLTSYNEERTLTGLDEHTTAMATLQTFTGNICITGAGGTGKTFLINQFLEAFSPEEKASTLIVCPTGKAADHLNGITIHKAFQLSNDVQLPDDITTVPKELLSVTRIIIDEVNMVRIDIFDKIMRMVQFIEETASRKIQVILPFTIQRMKLEK